ncbi:MAG: NAD(P)H-dependent oxidoreductase [Patescibacteria group bacterium]
MEGKLKIVIILASIREKRAGEGVAKWMYKIATQQQEIDPVLADLKDFPLPLYRYPAMPKEIEDSYSEVTEKNWHDTINTADGYILVTPEYNWGYPGNLKNALDYLYKPWNKKPVAFVSYGGLAAGTKSVQQLRQVAIALQMAPIRGEVNIPNIAKAFDESGQPTNPGISKQTDVLFSQLVWWAKALKSAREQTK